MRNFKERFLARIVKENNKTRLEFTGGGTYLRHRISVLPEGKEVLVTVETASKKRTEAQNNLYWLYLDIISRDTGNSKESLHELFRKKFLRKPDEEVTLRKGRYKLSQAGSTSELSAGEFVEYMFQIQDFSEIPIPDTEAWRNFLI